MDLYISLSTIESIALKLLFSCSLLALSYFFLNVKSPAQCTTTATTTSFLPFIITVIKSSAYYYESCLSGIYASYYHIPLLSLIKICYDVCFTCPLHLLCYCFHRNSTWAKLIFFFHHIYADLFFLSSSSSSFFFSNLHVCTQSEKAMTPHSSILAWENPMDKGAW